MKTTSKLTVWAPRTPGAEPTVVGVGETMADARLVARRFAHRRDLRHHDVVIRRDDKIVEKCGPCR